MPVRVGNPEARPSKFQGNAKVSLTMIVRDEERNLPQCLQSVEALFYEIVVVDTGAWIPQGHRTKVWRTRY